MTTREMHYDFKQKLNKLDSQKYRGLIIPEIDWKLNEAQEFLVKIIAQPRIAKDLNIGFEINQRTIEDIRPIVVNQKEDEGVVPDVFDESSFIAELPDEYWFYIGAKAYGSKGKCTKKKLKVVEIQHDDEAEESPFDRSSFEWGVTNARFINSGIRLFTDKSFKITKLVLDYIKKPRMIHNAQDYEGGTYNLMNGDPLTGSVDTELPNLSREIVDLAVLITTGDLNLPDYMIKQNKIKLTS